MKVKVLSLLVPALLVAGAANAAEVYNKDGNKLDLYGKVDGLHYFSDNKDVDGDQTYMRLGFKGETQVTDQLTGYGQWEYQIQGNSAENENNSWTRVAFAGLKFQDVGSFDYGRNYGVVYDVTSWTDVLPEFGGDTYGSDNFMQQRGNGFATYRNTDFFGLVDGLSFALQYQGKNDHDRSIHKQNGDGFSTAATYAFDNGIALSAGYSGSNRSVDQKADGNGDKAEAWATSAKYDANNVYAAVMYSQTYNMTPENQGNYFAGKTQNFEAVVQYQFDFGLRPSIGYVQTKGKDLQARGGFSGGDADLVKYVEVGTWYYFNKNMNVYAAYKFNQLDDNAYTREAGVATDDQAAVGIVYQF